MGYRNLKRNMLSRLREKKGTTLLECVVALVLFTAVMVMGATMFSASGVLGNRAVDLGKTVDSALNKAEVASSGTTVKTVTLDFENGIEMEVPLYEVIGEKSGNAQAIKFWKFALPPEGGPTT